jgi:hypothetical protein
MILGQPLIVRAQDWTAPYRPAMLPDFAGDMAAHANAPRYTIDLTLDVNETQAAITGHQTVIYTNRVNIPLDQIVFRLYPNLESYGAAMDVSAVIVESTEITPALDETRTVLSVPLPTPLQPGASVSVVMDFGILIDAGERHLYGQFSYLDGVLALPHAYPVVSVYEPGLGWWQAADHPQGDAVYSETAFYAVSITAPDELILAASGSEVDLIANDNRTLTHRYAAPLMRDFALMASKHFVTQTGEQDGVTITLYYDPQAAASAQAGLQTVQDTIRIFNQTYGRYPYTELDVVQTPNSVEGIEYPGLFVIATDIWDKDNVSFDYVIVHEAAHQWWYGLVGNDQMLEPWMDEALAQYSVAIFIRDQEGEEAYQASIESFRTMHQYFIESNEDQVIGLPISAYPELAYFYTIYQKGPLFYAALADLFGYDRLVQALRDYFNAYRYQIAQPDDLLHNFEITLGTDLNPIFEEWVGSFPVG